MDKLNRFFFPLEENEKLSVHDSVWFYGSLALAVTITALTGFATI